MSNFMFLALTTQNKSLLRTFVEYLPLTFLIPIFLEHAFIDNLYFKNHHNVKFQASIPNSIK